MSLARVDREVIGRIGLQAGDAHAMTRFIRALSIWRLRDLAQTVGVSAIVHDRAASGAGRPGYDRPGIAYARYIRGLGDLQVAR